MENYEKAVENLSYCVRTLIVQLSDLTDDYKQLLSSYEQSEREREHLRQQLIDNLIDPEIPF